MFNALLVLQQNNKLLAHSTHQGWKHCFIQVPFKSERMHISETPQIPQRRRADSDEKSAEQQSPPPLNDSNSNVSSFKSTQTLSFSSLWITRPIWKIRLIKGSLLYKSRPGSYNWTDIDECETGENMCDSNAMHSVGHGKCRISRRNQCSASDPRCSSFH
jgi:hypothetical protein